MTAQILTRFGNTVTPAGIAPCAAAALATLKRGIHTPNGTLWERVTERGSASARCSCARYADGSTLATLCPAHADSDPCARMAQITGKRRTGTISRGVCTYCGWQGKSVVAPRLASTAGVSS